MPQIPFFPQSRPLPNLPAPVLDRERRPTVDTRNLQQAVGELANAQKQPDVPMSLAEPFGALGTIGKSIQQAGGVAGALAIEMKKAQTDVQVAEFDKSADLEQAKFEQWKIDANADPMKWGEEWAKRVSGLRQQYAENQDLNHGAREAIGLRMTRWEGQSQASVTAGAAKEMFRRAKSEGMATLTRMEDNQDAEGFNSERKRLLDRGLIYPHEDADLEQSFRRTGERKRKEAEANAFDDAQGLVINFASGSGSEAAVKMLDEGAFGNYDPATKERLRTVAKQVGNQRAAESLDALSDGIVSGSITSAARIDELAQDDPHLSPKIIEEMKHYLATRDAQAERQHREEFGVTAAVVLRHQIADYDPAKDPERVEYMNLSRRIHADAETTMQGELTADLQKKYGLDYKGKLPPEIEQQRRKEVKAMFDSRTGIMPWEQKRFLAEKWASDGTHDDGKLIGTAWTHKKGDVKTVDGAPNGAPVYVLDRNGNRRFEWVTNKAAQEKAITIEAKVERAFMNWTKANPDFATKPEKVREAFKLIKEDVVAGSSAWEAMTNKLPPLPTGPNSQPGFDLFPR